MDEPAPRAERGEIRYLVLDAIREQSRHGYEVIQHIEQRARSSYRPSPGVIYPTLQMLEELGHAKVVETDGRKAYQITDSGKGELEQNARAVDDFYKRFDEEPWEAHPEDFAEVMWRIARLVKTFKLGARRGQLTPEILRGVRKVLDEALSGLEDVLNSTRR
ncbi:MAG TPA: PadR family transcriptional regulator [Polyangiaceae bacterium]|jgi:DNA-binding PadR family transcriptional regulator|nr:PadR family transcriptional regulator [Polyangiaceae bacterium]